MKPNMIVCLHVAIDILLAAYFIDTLPGLALFFFGFAFISFTANLDRIQKEFNND